MNQAMQNVYLLQEIGDKMVEISKIADKLKELNSLLALNDNTVTQLSDHVSIQCNLFIGKHWPQKLKKASQYFCRSVSFVYSKTCVKQPL